MKRPLIYIAFLAMLLISCEEYYRPDLEVVPGLMVVESHLTNNPNQNFVKLTKALDFFSTSAEERIAGAKVDLIEVGGLTTKAIEKSTGYFTIPKTPVSGKKYLLRITYQKDIFESDPVTMPPIPNIDSLYTNHKIVKSFRTDAYGSPARIEVMGREICIDAPIKPSIAYYRFSSRAILQWVYPPPPVDFPPPTLYGWVSFYDKSLFNIAGPKQFSVSDQVKNHHVYFLGYDASAYLDSTSLIPYGWILILDQYGISQQSYNFHEKLNKQFSAEGSLFDPVLTQVYGNIHCKTDPQKIVAGFFDLNSYRQYRYFFYFGYNEKSSVIQRRINRYIEIPDVGSQYAFPPDFWENIYN